MKLFSVPLFERGAYLFFILPRGSRPVPTLGTKRNFFYEYRVDFANVSFACDDVWLYSGRK